MQYVNGISKEASCGLKISPMTNIQKEYYHDDKHKFFLVTAGRRSRKTLIGSAKLFNAALQNSNHKYFLGAPTQEQAESIFFNQLKAKCDYLGILAYKKEAPAMVRLANGTEIYVVGLDKPERIEGRPWHGCHITEMPNIKARAWAENIRPVLSDTNGFAILDGVPDYRFPHYIDLAEYASGGHIPEPLGGIGAKGENPDDPNWVLYTWLSADVLDAEQIEAAKRELDERIFRQEYEGAFVKAGMSVYYALSKDNYKDITFEPSRTTALCFDFNVDPMSIVVNQEFEPGKWCFVAEFCHRNSNTEASSYAVDEWLAKMGFNGRLYVTGDSTGSNRKTSASRTDWQIIETVFKNYRGYERKIRRTKNVKDRVNIQNAAFRNADGQIRQYINPKQCKLLLKDYLVRQWKSNGQELDDASGTIGHLSDAGSYHAMNWFGFDEGVESRWY